MTALQAMVVCCVGALQAPGAVESAARDAAVAAIVARVEATAGSRFAHSMTTSDLDPATMRVRLAQVLDAALPEPRSVALQDGLAAFRLLPRDVDLKARTLDAFDIALTNASDPTDLAGQVKATRALALQLVAQRAGGAARFLAAARNDDERLARLATLFGLALDLAERTLREHATQVAAAIAAREVGDPGEWDAFRALGKNDARPWQIGIWTFALIDGPAFVRAVRDRDPAALERLLDDPPISSAQIRDPESWLTDRAHAPDVVAPDLSGLLGDGVTLVADETLGALQLELFVEGEGEPVRALRAAEGLRSDRYRVYRTSADEVVLVWVAEFQTEQDAGEAIDALFKVFARRFHVVTGERPTWPEDTTRTHTEHRGADGAVLEVAARRGTRVVYLSGPGADRPELLEAAFGK